MKRLLAIAILPALAFLLAAGSVVAIIVRAGDDDEKPRPAAGVAPGEAAPVPQATEAPRDVKDACSTLSPQSVGRAIGRPPDAMRGVPRITTPGQGVRGCDYQDSAAKQYVFSLDIRDHPDAVQAREEAEALTGTSIEGLGDVSRYEQRENGTTTITVLTGRREVFLSAIQLPVPQGEMVRLVREVLSKA